MKRRRMDVKRGRVVTRKRVALVGLPALLAAGYVGYWHYLAGEMQRYIEKWEAAREFEGVDISHGEIQIGGFPLLVRADIAGPSLSQTSDGRLLTWQAEALTISFPPWDFLTYTFDSPGRHLLAAISPQRIEKWSLEAERAVGVFTLNAGDDLAARVTIELAGVAGANLAGDEAALADGRFVLSLPAKTGAGDPNAPVATLDFSLDGVTLPASLQPVMGRDMQHAAGRLTLNGPVVATDLAVMAAIWRDNGGDLVVENAELQWGAMDLNASGELRIDDANQPAGAIDARVVGHNEVVAALQDAGMLTPANAAMVNVAAGLFASAGDNGERGVDLEVRLDGGRLWLANVPLLTLPALPLAPPDG